MQPFNIRGDIMIKKAATKEGLRNFSRFPYSLYADDPNWIPPLMGVREQDFDRRLNPALEDVEYELYLACREDAAGEGTAGEGSTLGRIAAIVNRRYNTYQKEKTAFFGFFECADIPAAAAELLAAVRRFAAARGMTRIVGPVDLSTNYPCGVIIHDPTLPPALSTPPAMGTPYTKAYYPALLEACGLRKAMDYYAYTYHRDMGIPQRLSRLRPLLAKRYPGLHIRPLRANRLRQDMTALRQVFDDAFTDNWGFVPMSDREYSAIQQGFVSLRCLNSVFLATVDGSPAGILIATPDFNQKKLPRSGRINRLRLSILGVKPEYRGRGIESLLILEMLGVFFRQGYREIDCSLILENNLPMNTFISKEFGCPRTKIYRVYEQPCQ